MTSDSEFVAFVNHAIQMTLDLTTYPNIWAVLSILLETQDINMSCVQVMHNLPYHARFNDILTEYPAWSTDTNDIESINKAQYRENRQEILNMWQKDTPVKT